MLVIAHRGASAAVAENTLEAFRAPMALGADWVELDVRRTADGAAGRAPRRRRWPTAASIVEHAVADLPPTSPTWPSALDVVRGRSRW